MYCRRNQSIFHPSPFVSIPVTPQKKLNIKIFVQQLLMPQKFQQPYTKEKGIKERKTKNLVNSFPRCKNVLKIPILLKPCQSVTSSGYVQALPWNTLNILPLPSLCSWCISHLSKLLQSSNTANKNKTTTLKKTPIFSLNSMIT